jgi:serine/threonine-protein kinase RsbW
MSAMGMDVRAVLPRNPAAEAEARRLIDGTFVTRVSTASLADLCLVTSEMVSNAVKHGRGQILLQAAAVAGAVRIQVSDEGGDSVPRIREQSEDDGGGWGLRIVACVSRCWGTSPRGTVWAEIATSCAAIPESKIRAGDLNTSLRRL